MWLWRQQVARYHSLYGKPETLPPEVGTTTCLLQVSRGLWNLSWPIGLGSPLPWPPALAQCVLCVVSQLHVTALSEDGIVMAIEHTGLPIAAVQFHPESILTNPAHGLRMLANAVASLNYKNKA